MFSESIWKKQNTILQQDANNISILKKEINKQAEIDATVQVSISDKIQNLKQNAAILAKKLQNQKHRNNQLETIIKYMKGRMETQKLQEASFRDNINSESLASLENKLKKLQYDLGQVNGKTNRITQNVQDKRSKISQNRTERVIDSGIFRNIQKELTYSELTFKKLLIEKVRYQKEYQRFVQQYEQLKQKAQKTELYAQKDIPKGKVINQSTSQSKQSQSKANSIKKFKKLQSRRQTKGRALTIKCEDQIDYEEQKEVVYVKKLLSRTGIDSCGDLIFLFQHVDQLNEKYFNEMNNYIDQGNEIERYLSQAKASKNDKAMHFYLQKEKKSKGNEAAKLCQEMKIQLNEKKKEIQKEHQQFESFFGSQNFKKLTTQIEVQLPNQEENAINYQNLIQTLQLLEKNIQQLVVFENQIPDKKANAKINNSQNLNQLISRVKKNEEFLKVMKKQDFQEEYHKIVKNISQKTLASSGHKLIKNKSIGLIKK